MSEATPAPLTRRARKRLETYDELVGVCRDLLNDGSDMSLRAVAARMGMTSPGLYRYVDSVEALDALVAGAILDDVVRELAAARGRHPDDPAAQLAGAAARLRSWALSRTKEFRHVFSTPYAVMARGGWQPVTIDASGIARPATILTRCFGEVFAELATRGLITVPSATQLGPDVVAVVEQSTAEAQHPWLAPLGDKGPGTMWLLQLAWARLYGALTMEVFGLIDATTVESGLVFTELLRETFDSLGLGNDWARLKRIATETAQ